MTPRPLPTFAGPNRTGELQLNFHEVLARRELVVRRVHDVTPRYRRIVFDGVDPTDGLRLARFAPLDHVKLYFPDPASGVIVSYERDGDDWVLTGGPGDPIRRDYTPRAYDPDTGEVTFDFVLHGHGIAGDWAQRATPGDALVAMGPSANWLFPEDYAHYLVVGDETAIPAISRIIEEAPPGAEVTAIIEVADAGEEQQLVGPATLDLRWVHRDTAPVVGEDLSALETAVRRVALPQELGGLFVFAAGETGTMTTIRRYFRRERGLQKRQVIVDGYWKRGVIDFDHHDVDLDD